MRKNIREQIVILSGSEESHMAQCKFDARVGTDALVRPWILHKVDLIRKL